MSRKLSNMPEDESNEIIQRYEAFLSNRDVSGYFDVEEMEKIVDYYLRKGRTKESSNALAFGFKLHPNSTILKIKRAKIYLATGDFHKAFRILESLGEQGDYDVMLLKIEVLARLERLKEALILCNQLINSGDEEIDVVCLDIAYIFLAQFDIKNAFKFLVKGAKHNPYNDELLFELAFCYEQNNETTKAIDTYNKIIGIDPYTAEAWFNLGQIYFTKQLFHNALDAYSYARIIRAEDSLTCLQKAHTHYQLQQYSEALEEYFAYEKMTTDNWHTYLFIGECYEREEKYDEAILYFQKSLDENSENLEALLGISVCLIEQERFAESIAYIRSALEFDENDPEIWAYLGEALMGIDDIEGAVAAYLNSVRFDANQPDILMVIANIFMERGEFSLALKYYKDALKADIHQELENIHLCMAVAYFYTGNKAASQISLKKAINKNLDALKLFEELCPEA